MKKKVETIINTFANNDQKPDVVRDVLNWIGQDVDRSEKDEALSQVWAQTQSGTGESLGKSLNAVYAKIAKQGGEDFTQKQKSKFLSFAIRAVAAVALILLSVAATLLFEKTNSQEASLVEYYSTVDSIRTLVLPDGSIAKLNTCSHILVPSNFGGETRTVYLVGEACFKVKKNPQKPFIVNSSSVSVTALGTEFNVSAYPEENSVVATLLSGKVKVVSGKAKQYFELNQGEQIVYSKISDKSSFRQADMDEVTAWLKGDLIFKGATVEEIINSFERYYHVNFQYNVSKFNADRYNLKINAGTTLEESLSVLKLVTGGFNYQIDGSVCKLNNIKPV